jgi:hypothetical protein
MESNMLVASSKPSIILLSETLSFLSTQPAAIALFHTFHIIQFSLVLQNLLLLPNSIAHRWRITLVISNSMNSSGQVQREKGKRFVLDSIIAVVAEASKVAYCPTKAFSDGDY